MVMASATVGAARVRSRRRESPARVGGADALLYVRSGVLDTLLPPLSRVAFNPHLIIQGYRIAKSSNAVHSSFWDYVVSEVFAILSAFYHLSETHFFYNMTSLKGIQLETSMGCVEFASMVASLLGLSQGITLLLSKGLLLFGNETAYYDQFDVGFSGVLFGMKVVLNVRSDDFVFLHGMVIPAK